MKETNPYHSTPFLRKLKKLLSENVNRLQISGLCGSQSALMVAAMAKANPHQTHLVIASGRDEALYMLNDIENVLGEQEASVDVKRALFFPTTYRRPYQTEEVDNANVLQRSEVLKAISSKRYPIVVTYADALCEKVPSNATLRSKSFSIKRDEELSTDDLLQKLQEYGFEREDFVSEPGQFALRGGIIDIFSFATEYPYRVEMDGDEVVSLRHFDPSTQLSVIPLQEAVILPNLEAKVSRTVVEKKVPLSEYLREEDLVWTEGLMRTCQVLDRQFAVAQETFSQLRTPVKHTPPEELYCDASALLKGLIRSSIVEMGGNIYFEKAEKLVLESEPQPTFNKQFDLLNDTLRTYAEKGYNTQILAVNEKQADRLKKVLTTLNPVYQPTVTTNIQLSHGFVDHSNKLLIFTDHEIFERYHKFHSRDMHNWREALTLKELMELKPGDFVVHMDYGVGRFSGLEKVENNGKTQEVIRLIYKDNDTLYISIHSLHKISRYVGQEGTAPALNRLGSPAWQAMKQKTKKQVKDIAKDLIRLYAKRKASQGFAYSADSYLQNELEASFLYEDTPDQFKATQDVKHDMEATMPMDRLVCGDVGFGKTEVAIRAAFKAVCDSKQVAVLVPATILAFQHYNTFVERLSGMPVKIDYLNRFRTAKDKTRILKELAEGKIDILIGTHSITGKGVKFKDLGLLIIDEEQKFGVSSKEKLRQMKVNVDCLTLTATPIPRTLQFSLMGARDLSVIQTPPPNRQPIETHLESFDEEVMRDAIAAELIRGGQAFVVSNRVETLPEVTGMVQRLLPDARVAMAHGQMEGKKVEETLMRFMEGDVDVLVATSIIENGLDIPNANTMIVINAQQFGLSDLHQMRGRVGRSNRKAFCYLFVPEFDILTEDAKKRLRAIEEFSTIGSGFNIAMRDLDIRGAGNILGAEQSGFISEIGYDMYHKILNEAIEELKMTDFKDLFQEDVERKKEYVRECVIETDLEVLIPDSYVSSISERLLLYRELNDLSSDEELKGYGERLADRFGPVPPQTQELIRTIVLRRMGKEFGIEKLVLKNGKMTCKFVSNQDNPFYQSANFRKMIQFAQIHAKTARLKETKDNLSLVCDGIDGIGKAISTLQSLMLGA